MRCLFDWLESSCCVRMSVSTGTEKLSRVLQCNERCLHSVKFQSAGSPAWPILSRFRSDFECSAIASLDQLCVTSCRKMSDRRIIVPAIDDVKAIALDVHDLPSGENLADALIDQAARLPLWIEVAQCYLAQGNITEYESFLKKATDQRAQHHYCRAAPGQSDPSAGEGFYPGAEYEYIQLLCTYSDFLVQKALQHTSLTGRSPLLDQAQKFIQRARELGPNEQLPRVASARRSLAQVTPHNTPGMQLLSTQSPCRDTHSCCVLLQNDVKGTLLQLEDAVGYKDNGSDNIAALLLVANLQFGQSRYPDALNRYLSCFSTPHTAMCRPQETESKLSTCDAATRLLSGNTLAVLLKYGWGWLPAMPAWVSLHRPKKPISGCCSSILCVLKPCMAWQS